MFPDNLTRDETQHRSGLLSTTRYRVEIDLSGRGLDEPTAHFLSTSTITYTGLAAGRTHVDLIAESVRSVRLDGVELDAGSFAESRLPLEVTAGEHELTVEAVCRYSRSGEGLHRFVDPVDDRTYLYTQFETADARRMFANFEQPDLKARYTISVVAPESWVVVSNGTLLDREPVAEGVVRARFSETELVSTYLTALVAGDYAQVVGAGYAGEAGEVPMAIYCRQSLLEHLDADEIFRVTTNGFAVFEDRFGHPYPFGKYDQVFVPEYNAGAMENIGCVVFRDEYIFRSRVTAASLSRRQDTILHELSHMWFGDLVTMRWWDDLWLKESFATWASNFAVSEQSDDQPAVWGRFLSGFKTNAYRGDQLPSTHPIAADMVDLEAVESNFDQITYAKGGSVLVQLVGYVGREAFLAGIRTYFARHAFGNTSLADLLAALQESSGRDLSAWSAQWLETAGVNTLELELESSEGVISAAAVRQTAPAAWPTLRDHRIAVGGYRRDGEALTRVDRLEVEVSGELTPVPELLGRTQPDLLLNDDDLTYAKVRLDPSSLATALAALPGLANPLSRAVLRQALWDACRDALLPARQFAELVLHAVPQEGDATVVSVVLMQAATAVGSYTPPSTRAATQSAWQQGLRELLEAAAPGSDHQLSLARSFVAAARDDEHVELLVRWLADADLPAGLPVDPDLRWAVVGRLAALGRLDEAAIAAEEAADGSVTGQERAAGARAARPTAGAKAEAWRLAVEEDTIPNAQQSAICLGFTQRQQDELLAPYVERYFRLAEDISASRGVWARKGISMRMSALRNLFPWPTEQQPFLERLDAWLESAEIGSSVRRVVLERRDETLRALACQAVLDRA